MGKKKDSLNFPSPIWATFTLALVLGAFVLGVNLGLFYEFFKAKSTKASTTDKITFVPNFATNQCYLNYYGNPLQIEGVYRYGITFKFKGEEKIRYATKSNARRAFTRADCISLWKEIK